MEQKTDFNKNNKNIKLIAFDLDDTLLTKQKVLTSENFNALKAASDKGIEIVPATGRFWSGVPENIKNLDFINYAIIVNGAEIKNIKKNISVSKSEIPIYRAVKIMKILDDLPVIYDFIIDGKSWISRKNYEKVSEFALDEIQLGMLKNLRNPLDIDVYDFINSKEAEGINIQKIQIFTLDYNFRAELLKALPVIFPEFLISSSVPNNIEINDKNASKGEALKKLAEFLNIDIKNTMAFGDGLNDISMIKNSGIGVAMSNACQELKDISDFITLSCNESGVAEGIKKFCF